jgi:hypothetical protein
MIDDRMERLIARRYDQPSAAWMTGWLKMLAVFEQWQAFVHFEYFLVLYILSHFHFSCSVAIGSSRCIAALTIETKRQLTPGAGGCIAALSDR